jgi:hypothetical protein
MPDPGPQDFWSGFRFDPRLPAHARLRSTDADRERVRQLLLDAYADGRLSAEELHTRSARLAEPISMERLLLLARDLEPIRPQPASTARTHRVSMRDLLAFVVAGLVSLVLWWRTGHGFFWPLWVLVYTGIPLVSTVVVGRPMDRHEGRRGPG